MVEEIKNAIRIKNLPQEAQEKMFNLAVQRGLITQENFDLYNGLVTSALEVAETRDNNGWDQKQFNNKIKDKVAELSEDQQSQIYKYLALSSVLDNAVKGAVFSVKRPDPKERVEYFLKSLFLRKSEDSKDPLLLKEDDELKNVFSALQNIKNDMEVVLVHTYHPVIYHTDQAIKLAKDLNDGFANYLSSDESLESTFETLGSFMDKLKDGEAQITPQEKITVAQEAEIGRKSREALVENIEKGCKEWNEGIDKIQNWLKSKDKNLDLNSLKFNEDDKKRIFEIGMWDEGVDADGREKSTALLLAKTLSDHTNKFTEAYGGPNAMHPRQNSSVFRLLTDALVQLNYRESEGLGYIPSTDEQAFKELCDSFVSSNSEKLPKKYNSRTNLASQLGDQETEFLKLLIKNEKPLIDPEIKAFSLAFMLEYPKIFENFIDLNKDYLSEKNIPIPDSFEKMKGVPPPNNPRISLEKEFREYVKNQNITYQFNDEKKSLKIKLSEDGLYFEPRDETIYGNTLLAGMKKVSVGKDGKESVVDLTKLDRSNVMNLFKRLVLLDHANETYGEKCVDRHILANFGSDQDFYRAMLLFKEAGLIEMKDGKVHRVKVGIMPLLETGPDRENELATLEKRLEDPLIQSYFIAREQADIMLGFSDGAKDQGSFASEHDAEKAKEIITAIFKKKFGENFKVNFFEGRGKEGGRGGVGEGGATASLAPDSVAATARHDRTTQADEPMWYRICKSYGVDQMVSTILGVVKSAYEARNRSDLEKDLIEKNKPALEFIARESEDAYRELFRNKNEAGTLVDGTPKNGNISSRKGKRPEATGAQLYEVTRAVPVVLSAKVSASDFHDVGLHTALNKFEKQDEIKAYKIENGKIVEVSGENKLKALVEYPKFKTMMERRYLSLKDFNKDIALAYGKKLGITEFMKGLTEEVTGLRDKIGNLLGKKTEEKKPDFKDAAYVLSQALFLAGAKDKKVENNALFSAVQSMYNTMLGVARYFERSAGGMVR